MRRFRIFAKKTLLGVARATPGLGTELRRLDTLVEIESRQSRFEPGHSYSTIPDWRSFRSRIPENIQDLRLWGIDLNEEKQLALVKSSADSLGADFWSKGGTLTGPRYSWPNIFFTGPTPGSSRTSSLISARAGLLKWAADFPPRR